MVFTQVSTLLGKSDALTYMETLVRSHQHPEKRRECLQFLKVIVKQDRKTLLASNQEHIGHQNKLKALEDEVNHARDIDIFSDTAMSTAAIQTQLADSAQTASTFYLDGIQFTASDAFVIKGSDREFLAHHDGSALLSSLAVDNEFPRVTFEDATGIVIRGCKFNSDSTIQETVTFPSGLSSNITFEDCIFSSAGHSDSRFWEGAHNLTGTVTIKNCWVTGHTSWMNFDLSSNGGLATKALTSVVIQDCVFYNVKGSAAIRGLQGTPMTSCLIKGNKWIWDDNFALHNLFWSAIECNECLSITVENNEFYGKPSFKTTGTGYRGAVQCFSRDTQFALVFKGNRVENFNVALQLAFGNVGSPAQFYGLSSYEIDQGTCIGVWNFASLIYPWVGVDVSSNAATWQVLGGDKDPTITNLTLPLVKAAADWSTTDPANNQGGSGGSSQNPDVPLIDTLDCTGDNPVGDGLILDGSNTTVIELADSEKGYIRINNSVLLVQDDIKWFSITIHSNVIEDDPGRQWIDQVITPDGSAYDIIEQTRSFSDGTMRKRMMLGPALSDVPANVGVDDFFFKLYFNIMPIP